MLYMLYISILILKLSINKYTLQVLSYDKLKDIIQQQQQLYIDVKLLNCVQPLYLLKMM
jgi:hypothetical protein